MSMTIEQIREHLNAIFYDDLDSTAIAVDEIIDSIVVIQTDAYNKGRKDEADLLASEDGRPWQANL